ncbi:hypothetical protein TNCV_776321 [Trichonephila clavipes]|nr:hypothetical protein TNCV_776321 [Trichonephila clavipes]
MTVLSIMNGRPTKRMYTVVTVIPRMPPPPTQRIFPIALQLELSEKKMLDHIISCLDPQVLDFVEVRNPTTKAQVLQLVTKYEERHVERGTQGPINNVGRQDWDARRLPDQRRDGNWRNADQGDRSNNGNLNYVSGRLDRDDQSQVDAKHPIRISALRMTPSRPSVCAHTLT